MISAAAISSTLKNCHPERSLAVSKASRQAESKDPYPANGIHAEAGNSPYIVAREHESIDQQHRSREAAQECSPRRKLWASTARPNSPEGAKENTLHDVNAMQSI